MAQHFKGQISNHSITKDFSERRTSGLSLRVEVRPMLRSISISRGRGKCIDILIALEPYNYELKKLTALQVKNKGK